MISYQTTYLSRACVLDGDDLNELRTSDILCLGRCKERLYVDIPFGGQPCKYLEGEDGSRPEGRPLGTVDVFGVAFFG